MTRTPLNRRRGEQAYIDGSFLRTVAMVCLISLVLSGLIVYWIGGSTTPQGGGDHPAAAHPSQRADHAPSATHTATPSGQRPTSSRTGGDGCG
jgi:hypothetical protein